MRIVSYKNVTSTASKATTSGSGVIVSLYIPSGSIDRYV